MLPVRFYPKNTISLLNPKAADGTQSTQILPQSVSGGWSESSLGTDRIIRDTRRNNLLCQTRSNDDRGTSLVHPLPFSPVYG